MTVKLNDNGYTKTNADKSKCSVIGSYDDDEEVQEFLSNDGVIEPYQTDLEIVAAEKLTNNNNIYFQIDVLEQSLLRPLREYALDSGNQTALDKITQVEADIVILRGGLQ